MEPTNRPFRAENDLQTFMIMLHVNLRWVSLDERFRVSFFFSVQKCLDLHWNLGNVNGMEGNAVAGGLISL